MSDWFLLYLFTRLDAIGAALGFVTSAAFGTAVLACFISFAIDDEFNSGWMLERAIKKKAFARLFAKRAAIVFALLFPLLIALPSQKDVAIIVGGSVAIDAARSDEAKELAGDVMAAIRAKLKEAAQ